MEELEFHLERFDGPLDLLLSLVHKNKVDIKDIPILLIFEQYMEYINAARELDMALTGEFIDMASELLLIKSRMLLPKPVINNEEDPRQKLANALIEYQKAKEMAEVLSKRYSEFGGRITKDPEVIEADFELEQHDVKLLRTAFSRIMTRGRESLTLFEHTEPIKTIDNLLSYKAVSLPGKILGIMRLLYRSGEYSFEKLLMQSQTRGELIASFVALLELLRSQRVMILSDEGGLDLTIRLKMFHRRGTDSISDNL